MKPAPPPLTTSAPIVEFRHVSGISWPRSGHHLLVRLLTAYFGKSFVYCEFHQGHPTNPDLGQCCRTAPCSKSSDVVFSKNHDFDLQVPQIDGGRYLIQHRSYVPSVVSNYELAVRSGLNDNQKTFRKFASQQFGNFLDFQEKWVTSPFARSEDVLQLPYEDLVAAPEITLALAIRQLTVGHTPEEGRIKEVVAQVDGQKVADKKVHVLEGSGVHNARNVENFRYYNPNLFDAIEAMVLRREQVVACFESILQRQPAEENMVHMQGLKSLDALTAHLKKHPEYKQLVAKGLAQKADEA